MNKLEVNNLRISFRTNNGAVRAVRGISFELKEGETLAIVGESGSGKSVTARAIMGILAGNAMVDNGEIIYDGQDLLKISEEDFHTLRGHRLAMIFQDPLSALNPIMRIGKQLTEAMLLNNRERRRAGRRNYNRMVGLLEQNMAAASQAGRAGAGGMSRERLETFKRFVDRGVRLQTQYAAARESLLEATDQVRATRLELRRRQARAVREALKGLEKSARLGIHPWLIPRDDAGWQAALASLSSQAKNFSLENVSGLEHELAMVEERIKSALSLPEPAFHAIAFGMPDGHQALPQGDLQFINREAEERLHRDFMADFIKEVQAALSHSAAVSLTEKRKAESALLEALPVFRKNPLIESECKAAFTRCAAAVDKAIDPMQLEKDNLAYIFRSSMKTNIDRYFRGLAENPREVARFQRDTVKRQKLIDRNRTVVQVVPMNLVDTEAARENLERDITALLERYRHQQANPTVPSRQDAEALVAYLQQCAADYGYNLSKAMAKHRAIELMDEVGIPEPHKRYRQYPFEFSGGMRQRIVIAIALSANPDILICDEPTTALDVTIQAQILELINQLKAQRRLSVIFITHDLGVVANMADSIAVMYAGKIVEYGLADEVFYNPVHPYTWALLSSLPDLETKEKLEAIPGTPPNMIIPPSGDAFAIRNQYALELDFEEEPPFFRISDTHYAATWLLHPDAPKVEMPAIVRERIVRMRERQSAALNMGGEQP